MTSDNDNQAQDKPVEYFFFRYVFNNEGILASRLGEQETRDKLNRELASIYGSDGLNVVEFRQASEDEVEEMKQRMAEELGVPPTVN